MRKAIITGANGFIGSAICRELASRGVNVTAVVRRNGKNLGDIEKIPNISIVYCDLTEIRNLAEYVNGRDIDVMYHLAWSGSAGSMRAESEVQIKNVEYACDAVKACADVGCKRFVFASSIMEYEISAFMDTDEIPDISSLYASAKIAADYMARALAGRLGVEYIRAIISNVYGPGETSPRLINTSIRKLLKGEHCAFSSGEQMYDFIFIDDAAKAFVELGQKGVANRAYYIGSQTPKPLKEYLCEMRDQVAPGHEIGLGELPFKGVTLTYKEFDIHALERDTGFVPEVCFAEGIRKTADWLKLEDINGMKTSKLGLEGAHLINMFSSGDYRGSFTKSFEKECYARKGIDFQPDETFTSISVKNVIRGLHFQLKKPQAKLVCVIKGKVWDVIVDLRKNSPTYKKWVSVELSAENHLALYIPRGFAHGFLSLEDDTVMLYQCDGAYDKKTDTGIRFDDPEIGIRWPVALEQTIHSERDLRLMSFKEYEKAVSDMRFNI